MEQAPDLVGLLVRPLEEAGLSYMVTGGVAAVIYGDPRFTRDVDVVLELSREEIPGLLSAFDPEDYYVPPGETLSEEVARSDGGHFNLIHRDTALRADVYLAGDDPFHAWALERRVTLDVTGGPMRVAPLEYVVVRKLEYFKASASDRHLRDVAMMLRFSGDEADEDALEEWARRQEVAHLLEEAREWRGD